MSHSPSPPGASPSRFQSAWAFRIVTVAGIPIRVHFTFALVLLWVGVSASKQGRDLVPAFLSLFVVFLCVVLHELGHALMAKRFGVKTLEIVLYPIGGVARLKSLPSGRAEFLIALAGPAVNVALLGLLLPASLWLGVGITEFEGGMFDLAAPRDYVALGIWINGMLLLFNLIPAFPMDGGRILRSTLTVFGMAEDRATRIAAGIGQAIAVVFAIIGIVASAPFLVLIAMFVFLGAAQEAAFMRRRVLVRGRTAREAMVTRFATLAPQDSLQRAAELLLGSHQQDFPVVDAWGRVAGLLSRATILEGLARPASARAVLEIMDRRVQAVAPDSSMDEVIRRFQESGGKPLLVMDRGALVGMLTLEKLAEFIEVARVRAVPETEGVRPV